MAELKQWLAWLSPGALILLGVVLFFFPLPPTTLAGVILIAVGLVLWIIEWASTDDTDTTQEMPN
ncbi:hypothetical protein ACFO0N_22065 [Halobium salinum]|uniref:Uncharacterized protein n=1 Tax=Halobium salinum TaxID=1364940 RepID=A0ABD5PID1_9EURY|nr:hypothetical protein [Halobium salinum]